MLNGRTRAAARRRRRRRSIVTPTRHSRRRVTLTRPRAFVVVTGSELVRGDRTRPATGRSSRASCCGSGSSPARIVIVGDREDELEPALAEGLAAPISVSSPEGSGRRTTTGRSSSSRGRRGWSSARRRAARGDRAASRARFAARLGGPYADFEPGVRKQATIPEGALSLGLAGTAPGLVLEQRETRGRRAARAAGRAAALCGARALETEPVRRVLARAQAARAARCCASSARASPRSRRRSRRQGATATASRRRSARATSRSTSTSSSSPVPRQRADELTRAARRAARAVPLQPRRAPGRGDRARPLPRAGADARDRRVVHRWNGCAAAHLRPRVERRLPSARSWRTPTR